MDSRKSQLTAFGGMFVAVGVAIGISNSYGVLSFIFLGLGVLLPFIAIMLPNGEDDASSEGEQQA